MGRESKYRAYEKQRDLYGDVQDINFYEGTVVIGLHGMTCDIRDVELLQFTGLKDESGKEVFEDSLFKSGGEIYRIEYIQKYMTYAVFTPKEWNWYKAGSNHFKYCHSEESERYFLYEFDSYEIEIVGSINENPELLEVKE